MTELSIILRLEAQLTLAWSSPRACRKPKDVCIVLKTGRKSERFQEVSNLTDEKDEGADCRHDADVPCGSEKCEEEGMIAEKPASKRNRSDVVGPSERIIRDEKPVKVVKGEPRRVRRANCCPKGEHDEVPLKATVSFVTVMAVTVMEGGNVTCKNYGKTFPDRQELFQTWPNIAVSKAPQHVPGWLVPRSSLSGSNGGPCAVRISGTVDSGGFGAAQRRCSPRKNLADLRLQTARALLPRADC